MSHEIEFRHAALLLDEGKQASDIPEIADQPVYLCAVEVGDNRCFDMDGRIARHWVMYSVGGYSEMVQYACWVAADLVHGGMVKLGANSRWTKPENYIKRHRQILNDAVSPDWGSLDPNEGSTIEVNIPEHVREWLQAEKPAECREIERRQVKSGSVLHNFDLSNARDRALLHLIVYANMTLRPKDIGDRAFIGRRFGSGLRRLVERSERKVA